MTLFDVIRYPLIPDTDGYRLDNIPYDILLAWYKEDLCGYNENPSYEYIKTIRIENPSYEYIKTIRILNNNTVRAEDCRIFIKPSAVGSTHADELKKRIADYDPI